MRTRTNIVISCLVGVALVIVFLLRGSPDAIAPPLGFERVPDDENAALAALRATVAAEAPTRDHNPQCADAIMTVVDNLDPSLNVGVFAAARQYRARVRFSQRFLEHADPAQTGPAMAIKLYGIDGDFVREADSAMKTQDFLLGAFPAFVYPNAAALAAALDDSDRRSTSAPAATGRWWSMLPYRFGERHAVKYALRPCSFSAAPGCYELMIQFQSDPAGMPIEDASVAWDEVLSPFEPVAVLMLDEDSQSSGETCAAMTFSPWQSLAVHAPLGGINRARRVLDRRVPAPSAQ